MALDDPYAGFLLLSQRGVLSREQALTYGVTRHGLHHRLRPGGSWQRLLPGVYLTSTGEPTDTQRQVAALLYAGADSLITGLKAVAFHDIRGPRTEVVDVLVPTGQNRVDAGFVQFHRTRRMPSSWVTDLSLRYVRPARAVADAVRALDNLADARTVVASAVQQGRCHISQLADELYARHRGDALLRTVLAEVAAGIRSAPEGDLRSLIVASDLPQPLYNPKLFRNGEFLASPDGWWPDFGVAAEVESKQWHLLPEDWEHTLTRQRRMTSAGIYVLQFTPGQLRSAPAKVLEDISAALKVGRPVPGITTRPAAA